MIVWAHRVGRIPLAHWVDEQNGKWERGRIAQADREHLASWPARFGSAADAPAAFAVEGCTGWRYVAEEMHTCTPDTTASC
jgi:hypothetical protein